MLLSSQCICTCWYTWHHSPFQLGLQTSLLFSRSMAQCNSSVHISCLSYRTYLSLLLQKGLLRVLASVCLLNESSYCTEIHSRVFSHMLHLERPICYRKPILFFPLLFQMNEGGFQSVTKTTYLIYWHFFHRQEFWINTGLDFCACLEWVCCTPHKPTAFKQTSWCTHVNKEHACSACWNKSLHVGGL